MNREIGCLWEVLTQKSVGILVGAALPRALGIAEVDLHARCDGELAMQRHLVALVPGHRTPQLGGQRPDPTGHRSTDLLGSPVSQLEQHDEPDRKSTRLN